jgi:hypothetical protein
MKKFIWSNLLDLFLSRIFIVSLLSLLTNIYMALNNLLEYDLVDLVVLLNSLTRHEVR